MANILFLFLLIVAPMYAQETPAEATLPPADTNQQVVTNAPVPDKLASSPLIIRVNEEERVFPQTMSEIFLNKTFVVRRVADGADRSPSYLPGILSNDIYILPIEIRSRGRRYTVANFFFRVTESGDPYLFRWEELNFINRSILRYELFGDVLRAPGYIDQLIVQPPRKSPQPPVEAPVADTQSSTNVSE
ncbi:MAG: hypothetical protein ACRCY4_03350 [Brevinema sp.]